MDFILEQLPWTAGHLTLGKFHSCLPLLQTDCPKAECFETLSAMELAEQITLLDHIIFRSIPYEWVWPSQPQAPSGRTCGLRAVIPKADVCAQRCESWSYCGLVPLQCLLVPVYARNIDLATLETLKVVTLCFSMFCSSHGMYISSYSHILAL